MRDEERQQHYASAEKLLAEQNFMAAVVAGAIAMLLAAAAFGIVASTWAYSYGFAAAGVGMIIGATIGFLGRGIETKYGVLAAAYTILGCLLGNLLRVIVELAQSTAAWPVEVLRDESLPALVARSLSLFSRSTWFTCSLPSLRQCSSQSGPCRARTGWPWVCTK